MRHSFRILLGVAGFAALMILRAAAEPASPADTAGVTQCRVQQINGTPVLVLDGKRTAPLIFFFNSEAAGSEVRHQYWVPQVKLAAAAGVHIYSMGLNPPPLGADMNSAMQILKFSLDPFIAGDPQALFIPRINVTASAAWLAAHPNEQMVYADGSRGFEAIASEVYTKAMHEHLRRYLEFIEASPYGRRMIAYHISGQNAGEWLPEAYREKGPDVGPANTAGFRAWLKAKYGSDEALQKAWGNAKVTLATAAVPVGAPGRFPLHNTPPEESFEAFYRLPEERNWVDYSQYTSELTARRLVEYAQLIKDVTQRRKLSVFFYGYILDLPASMGGHYDLMRLLQSPDVDLLASPTAYAERLRGESTGYMAPIDSVSAHGKLWVIENDMRTHLWRPEHQPPEIANDPAFIAEQAFIDRPKEGRETVEILRRDFSSMRAHRCGTWWMDLCAIGSFKDPAIWQMIDHARPAYEKFYLQPSPYRPEAALIIDEFSRFYEKSDWDLGNQVFTQLRHQLGLTGASFGIYLMEDFLTGRVPPCKAYIFANAFKADEKRIEALRERLEREGATAVWVYAPGWLAESGTSLEQSQKLTGMTLVQKDGLLGSYSVEGGAMGNWGLQTRGLESPKTFTVSPRLIVSDPQAQAIGRYFAGGGVSAAIKREGRATHAFVGDINLTVPVLRRLLSEAKVHLWTDGGLAVHTDGTFLSVHAAETGIYPIYLPEGVSLKGADDALGRTGNTLFVPFGRSQTRLFQIRHAGE